MVSIENSDFQATGSFREVKARVLCLIVPQTVLPSVCRLVHGLRGNLRKFTLKTGLIIQGKSHDAFYGLKISIGLAHYVLFEGVHANEI